MPPGRIVATFWGAAAVEYEWDEGKRLRNRAKHGIDFAKVEQFEWESVVRFPDTRKPYGEPRWLALGSIGARVHVLIYTERLGRVRVISLRKANNKETASYEQAIRAQQP